MPFHFSTFHFLLIGNHYHPYNQFMLLFICHHQLLNMSQNLVNYHLLIFLIIYDLYEDDLPASAALDTYLPAAVNSMHFACHQC